MSDTQKKVKQQAAGKKASKTVKPKAESNDQAPAAVAKAAKEPKREQEKAPKDPLVVFAIRLTEAERTAIHQAAGPRNATQFVRAVALAAAREDDAAFQQAIADARALRV
jgi:hypothetical protein